MEISERITQRRKYLGMSKRDLAEKLNVHETSVSKYELGKVDFPVSRIKELAKVLEVSEVWLLGLDEVDENTLEIEGYLNNLMKILNNEKEVTFKGEPIGLYYQQYALEILKETIQKIKKRQKLIKILKEEQTDPSIAILKENPEKLKKQAKEDVEKLFSNIEKKGKFKQVKNPSSKEERLLINTTKEEKEVKK